jgi:hypothetical protein
LFALLALLAFTLHWYPGFAPPLVAVAVKVTGVPEQTVVAVDEMVMLTGTSGIQLT